MLRKLSDLCRGIETELQCSSVCLQRQGLPFEHPDPLPLCTALGSMSSTEGWPHLNSDFKNLQLDGKYCSHCDLNFKKLFNHWILVDKIGQCQLNRNTIKKTEQWWELELIKYLLYVRHFTNLAYVIPIIASQASPLKTKQKPQKLQIMHAGKP